jgi:hypothetical protein
MGLGFKSALTCPTTTCDEVEPIDRNEVTLSLDGMFWLSDSPSAQARGILSTENSSLEIFDQELVASQVVVRHEGYTETTQLSDNDVYYDIRGQLADGTQVSIHDALRGEGIAETGSAQSFQFTHTLVGREVGSDEPYQRAVLEFASKWERAIGHASWDGRLSIPKFGSVHIECDGASVAFNGLPDLTMSQIERFVTGPLRTLLTLLSGTEVTPIETRLYGGGDAAVIIIRDLSEDLSKGKGLISLGKLDLVRLDKWYEIIDKTMPAGTVVTDAFTSSDASIELRIMALAASLEGIHREIYRETRMSKKAADQIRHAAVVGVEAEFKAMVSQLLLGLSSFSYDERIHKLLDRLGHIANDLCGPLVGAEDKGRNRWVTAVKQTRNGVAHLKRTSPEDLDLYVSQMYTLYESLRFVTTAVLLNAVQVPLEDIENGIRWHPGYALFRGRARKYWADIYSV